MTGPADTTQYPPPEPERVERALRAMRARRAKLRRLRIAAASGALVVLVGVAILAVGVSPAGTRRLRVAGPSSSTTVTSPTMSTTVTATLPTVTAAPTTVTDGTQEITYQPFTATGAFDPSLHVTTRETGTCITGDAERSYRCFGTGAPAGVYDPCFAGPNGANDPLVCPLDPATGDVVEFTVTTALPSPPVNTTRPWAMQLSGGTVCMFVSAAWGGLGPYDCQSGNSAVTPADCRVPQSSAPWWTAECQDQQTEASPFTAQRVVKVWF